MARSNSSKSPITKPEKPYPDFPLFPHASGRWAKKILGRFAYFGPWDDWQGALDKFNQQKDDLFAGRRPKDPEEKAEAERGKTIKELCNAYWNAKKAMVKTGELSPRTFRDVDRIGELVVKHFGAHRLLSDITQADFAALRSKMAERLGPVALGNDVQRVRCLFKWAYDAEMIPAPIRWGTAFKKPAKKVIRRTKREQGKKLFKAAEIRRIIDNAPQPLKAMVLLGINCGFGNADCGTLPLSAIDLDKGWIEHARPKTEVERRCPLWPETIEAMREALAMRPAPKDEKHAGLAFITSHGFPWHKDIPDSPVTKEMRKVLDKLDINGHRNFYCLRHSFQTIGDETKDFPAVSAIMGHEVDDMASRYREDVSEARLRAVAKFVRGWLFGTEGQP